MSAPRWRRCSVCKQDILCGQVYWVCSVSTCNRKRTGLAFCSTSCWDAHVPVMRHRDSWAIEEQAPRTPAPPEPPRGAAVGGSSPVAPRPVADPPSAPREPRRIVAPDPPRSSPGRREAPREILIVASKLKQYIRAVSGMNTSDKVSEALSDHVRALCDEAIEAARGAERRTVLERDIPPTRRR